MSSHPPVTIPGVILPDGTLDVARDHGLPAGPVRVSLVPLDVENGEEAISGLPRVEMPLPDPPILDTAISAPCDLPLTGPVKRIYPKRVEMPLPDPFDESDIIE